MSDLIDRLRGIYRVSITDGYGPAGGDEPDNAKEFVSTFETTPIQHEAASALEANQQVIETLRAALEACRATFLRNGWSDKSVLIEGIDAALLSILHATLPTQDEEAGR